MKRFWHTWLAVVASAAMVSTASAQNDWNQSSEIGSYQSIMARAGYTTTTPQALPSQNAVALPAEQVLPGNGPVMDSQIGNSVPGQPCSGGCGGQCDGGCGSGSYGNASGGGLFSRFAGGTTNCASGSCGTQACSDSGSDVNYVVGVRALFMRRDQGDQVQLTRNGAGDFLGSNSTSMQNMGGVDVGLTRRNCNGNGIEFRYWGLYPDGEFSSLAGPGLSTYLTTLSGLNVQGFGGDLQTYFDGADSNESFRQNEIHNVEANFLRNGGNYTTHHGRSGNFELLGGFRWFQFNEDFRYSALSAASNPSQVNYDTSVENALLGGQLGGRNEVCVTDRLSFASALKVGVFNNSISHYQSINDSNGQFGYRTALGTDDYSYGSTENGLSVLGELDLGINYRFSQCCRLTVGYRVVGITGIALAPAQIPSDFQWEPEIYDVNHNGNLNLYGGYAGIEFCH